MLTYRSCLTGENPCIWVGHHARETLFADTEAPKNHAEEFLGIRLSRDFADGVERGTQLLRDEFRREVLIECFARGLEKTESPLETGLMPGVDSHSPVAMGRASTKHARFDCIREIVETGARLAGDANGFNSAPRFVFAEIDLV
jgi:hypothetical protein